MNKAFIYLFFGVSIMGILSVNAQSDFSGWFAGFTNFRISNKVSIHNDIQIRSTNQWEQTQTILIRAGVNYHLREKIIVTGGYAFISNKKQIGTATGFFPEHRLWEQLLLTYKIKSITGNHRFRIEQRFIPNTILNNNQIENNGYVFANRFRYFNRNVIPLKKKPRFEKGFFTALQNEIFFNLGKTNVTNGKFFDQNRFYIATGFRLHPSIDFEVGYLHQSIAGKSGQHSINHILQLACYLRMK